ncbi:hypothetical protein NE237_005357 [Protea cynaroides]|uniref:THUMP domain-containing protein n=1 Tax=Protea cynaroides TaxID=273540 RepID=A0A9Q0KKC9_9MAGN|nr:hypothetical protein NE237_005357 [Protea cynaroides]
MAAEDKLQSGNIEKSKKRKHRYLPFNRHVKRGTYPLRPGVHGFFITCDGGREKQASNEAINVLDNFYEELVHGEDYGAKCVAVPNKPLNKIIKFSDSDSSSEEDDEDKSDRLADDKIHEKGVDEKSNSGKLGAADYENQTNEKVDSQKEDADDKIHEKGVDEKSDSGKLGAADNGNLTNEKVNSRKEDDVNHEKQQNETEEAPAKKQRLQTDASNGEKLIGGKTEEKSIDKLIEAELEELGDRNKRRFVSLDSGCNGIIFIQMHKRAGNPSPKEIVQHMMTSAASTRKHMSRFILRVLPVEVTCYASEEEISKEIKPLIAKYFPAEAPTPQKFAVLYDARANTGIDRMSIINSVAKSVPGPHKVDLNNPDKTIIVQVVKTICLIGVVEKYKELSKYNLRQLTSPKP